MSGFNFCSPDTTVVLKKVGGGFLDVVVPCDVMADDEPPTTGASCSVRDILTFTIPRTIRAGVNNPPLPPGRWTIEAHVPNDPPQYAPSPGPAPAEFVSNVVTIDLLPPLDLQYQVTTERGNCYNETDGWGSDEAWFRSYGATYLQVGSQGLETKAQDVFREDDLDSGDWIGFPLVTLFQGRLDASGCTAIAILGLEVDSEDAAKDQIDSFGEAYELYWKQIYTQLTSSAAGGYLGDGIAAAMKGAGITASLIVGGVGLLVIAALGLLFAAWAAADPIAYDLMVYDLLTLNQLTTPGAALPPGGSGQIGSIVWSRLPQSVTPTSATTADYREERQYHSDDEGSRYGLDFKISQLP